MSGPHRWRKNFKGQVNRWTAPREAVLRLLSRTSHHLSAKDIFSDLRRIDPQIGLTTVYRTLDLLHRVGILHKIDLGDGQARYELKSGENKVHHHHLICTSCSRIIDYTEFEAEELDLVKKTEKRLSEKYHFLITDHNIEFLGLCRDCRGRDDQA